MYEQESTTTTATMERQDRRRRTYHLDAQAQERVTGHLRMAYMLAHRFARTYGLDREETQSVAVEWLCRAAALFDPARGVQFITYAYIAVERALIHYKNSEFRRRRVQAFFFRR